MKNNQKRTLLIILIFVAVFIMTIGSIYSYYYKKGLIKDKTKVYINTVALLIQYESGNKVYIQNIEKNLDYNYYFSIQNTSKEHDVKYNLIFEISSSLSNTYENLTYSIEGKTNLKKEGDKTIKVENSKFPNNKNIHYSAIITKNQIHYYTLNIKYNGQTNKDVIIGEIKIQNSK